MKSKMPLFWLIIGFLISIPAILLQSAITIVNETWTNPFFKGIALFLLWALDIFLFTLAILMILEVPYYWYTGKSLIKQVKDFIKIVILKYMKI